jgi:hypothetical protein
MQSLRGNKPISGSISLKDIFANTGKPCKTSLFCSSGEYVQFSLILPKYGRFTPHQNPINGL